jgi:hypothetical protein
VYLGSQREYPILIRAPDKRCVLTVCTPTSR